MTVNALGTTDKLFIYGENRETMMHVAGLMIFSPPPDASPTFVKEMVEEILRADTVEPPWNMRLATPNFKLNPFHTWVKDENFDMDYHVRHSALPAPGGERELGKLVSRLHSNPIDFSRPPWEMHIIEGLEGGRFALYCKTHHALVDGYTANMMMTRSLSTSPDDRQKPMYFAIPQPKRERAEGRPGKSAVQKLGQLAGVARGQIDSVAELVKAVRTLIKSAVSGDPALKGPLQAPDSIMNSRIGRNRRFATQQIPLDRIKTMADAGGGTINDVLIALCAGSLRRFLDDMGALPKRPLVAWLPVNVRPKGDQGGGNAIGAILVSMATTTADPKKRFEAIVASTTRAKDQFRNMSTTAIMEYSLVIMLPYLLQFIQAMTGNLLKLPVNFNVCISNVPGPDKPLYLRGARMEAVYPVSIPSHAQALNITVQSYVGYLNFGFIGCRDTLPHLQKLAVYTREAFEELEAALLGIKPAKVARPKLAKPAATKAKAVSKPAKAAPARKTKVVAAG